MTARQWTLVLPYATVPLSLNDRRHWGVVHRAKQNLTGQVRQLCLSQRIPRMERIHVVLHYVPARARVRDADNLMMVHKVAVDGLRDYAPRYVARPSRTSLRGAERVMVDAGWTGIVADDDPTHVTWSPPVIEPVDKDHKGGRLSLVITEVQG